MIDRIKQHIISIDVYTDGSLKMKSGNLYGCGYGIYFPGKELKNVSAPFTISPITNNRAELHAIHQAIVRIIKNYTFELINIYTDSQYAQMSLTVWIHEWKKKNNWKNSKKKPVENQDLIMKIDKYLQRYHGKINIQWVRAHAKGTQVHIHSAGNAKADALANRGSDKYAELYGN
jgi:ribonuclease HI